MGGHGREEGSKGRERGREREDANVADICHRATDTTNTTDTANTTDTSDSSIANVREEQREAVRDLHAGRRIVLRQVKRDGRLDLIAVREVAQRGKEHEEAAYTRDGLREEGREVVPHRWVLRRWWSQRRSVTRRGEVRRGVTGCGGVRREGCREVCDTRCVTRSVTWSDEMCDHT